jgi:hypothetical protein
MNYILTENDDLNETDARAADRIARRSGLRQQFGKRSYRAG